jgi:hypothetical protein
LIKDRLNLGLLFGSQVQLLGDPTQTERMPVSSAPGARLCLDNDKAANGDRTGGCKC